MLLADVIGQIEEELKEISKNQSKLTECQIKMREELIEIKLNYRNLDDQFSSLKNRFDTKIDQLESFKNKMIGIAITIPIVVTILIFLLSKIF